MTPHVNNAHEPLGHGPNEGTPNFFERQNDVTINNIRVSGTSQCESCFLRGISQIMICLGVFIIEYIQFGV